MLNTNHPKPKVEKFRYKIDGQIYTKIGVGMGETPETSFSLVFVNDNTGKLVTLYNDAIEEMELMNEA